MDVSTGPLHDLLHLSHSVGIDDHELDRRFASLVAALRAAVPSYRGIDVTMYDAEQPIRLTAFLESDGGAIRTSLRLPFVLLGTGFHPDSRAVFYAATPGTFVDLAAHFGQVLQAPVIFDRAETMVSDRVDGDIDDDGHPDVPRSIVLDAELPPPTAVSAITGLAEASTINRAVGMVIEQGLDPDEARRALRDQAAAAGVELPVFAARMPRG